MVGLNYSTRSIIDAELIAGKFQRFRFLKPIEQPAKTLGDSITIDPHKLLLQLNVSDEGLAISRKRWIAPSRATPRPLGEVHASGLSTASKGEPTAHGHALSALESAAPLLHDKLVQRER
jgi:hypothetical protein